LVLLTAMPSWLRATHPSIAVPIGFTKGSQQGLSIGERQRHLAGLLEAAPRDEALGAQVQRLEEPAHVLQQVCLGQRRGHCAHELVLRHAQLVVGYLTLAEHLRQQQLQSREERGRDPLALVPLTARAMHRPPLRCVAHFGRTHAQRCSHAALELVRRQDPYRQPFRLICTTTCSPLPSRPTLSSSVRPGKALAQERCLLSLALHGPAIFSLKRYSFRKSATPLYHHLP
jgi:hypothetical protein